MMGRGLGLLVASVFAALVAAVAGFSGGYLVGIGNLESLQLRLQTIEDELRRAQRDIQALEPTPSFRYFPPEEE